MKLFRLFAVAMFLVVLLLLTLGTKEPTAKAATMSDRVTTGQNSVGGVTVYWIRANLQASNVYVWPQGAANHKPKYNAWDPEARWDDGLDHGQGLLEMYNGSTTSWKVGMINTDYFCYVGTCAGNKYVRWTLLSRHNLGQS